MQLNLTTDYAVRTLLCLLGKNKGEIVPANDIVALVKVPYNYVQHIMAKLRGAGYVETVRGQFGGYRLTDKADEATVFDIVNLYEPEKIHHCLEKDHFCTRGGHETCPFSMFMEHLQGEFDRNMKSIKLRALSEVKNRDELYELISENRNIYRMNEGEYETTGYN